MYIKKCEQCNRNKYDRQAPHPELNITEKVYQPFQGIHMDTFVIGGQIYLYKYTCVDAFTKFAQAIPIRSKNAIELAEAIITYFFSYGIPAEIIMDGGTEFTNELVRELLEKHKDLSIQPVKGDIHNLSKILKVKPYLRDRTIVYVILEPLVEKEPFNYYHLYPLSFPVNESYFISIQPTSNFLAINKKKFIYNKIQWMEFNAMEYICDRGETHLATASLPCEVQLLTYSNQYGNCVQTLEKLQTIKTMKLLNNQWLVIVPNTTLVKKICNKNQEIEEIYGRYLQRKKKKNPIEIKEGSSHPHPMEDMGNHPMSLPLHGDVSV
ncbi:Integrase core domain [Popillia japonica]|uniref:Integrase core domain n=1 Tax=Popillia japonica TaxID=7064 RepID=A0AAW1HSY4_POPJA